MLRPISSSSGSTVDRSSPSSGQWRISSSYWFWHSGQVRDKVVLRAKAVPDQTRGLPAKFSRGQRGFRPTPPQLTLAERVLSRVEKPRSDAGMRRSSEASGPRPEAYFSASSRSISPSFDGGASSLGLSS